MGLIACVINALLTLSRNVFDDSVANEYILIHISTTHKHKIASQTNTTSDHQSRLGFGIGSFLRLHLLVKKLLHPLIMQQLFSLLIIDRWEG